jgi:ubiquinone/menaquinone biosynthesis C-methylase UbiE
MRDHNLLEGSKSYHSEADVYERFSRAEDAPQKVRKFLMPLLKNKDVLDLGCGTGKYLAYFARCSRKYYALDSSREQLSIAKAKDRSTKTVFLCSSAEDIPLPDGCVDIAISTWVLGTISGARRRKKALLEMARVLRKHGRIYLVENDIGGEFEEIRNRYPNSSETRTYNKWLEDNGFRAVKRFKTSFRFGSTKEARTVFAAIWGSAAGNRVKSKTINHRVIIYKR